MQKSTIRLLPISLLFLLAACGSNPVKDLVKVPLGQTSFHNSYFADPKMDYVYKTNISVYGNELSGICIIKKTGEKHRVVLTTEFGNKLIDLEISPSDYKVNAIVEELDRKMLIAILVNDFRLLLRENYQITQEFETAESVVLQSVESKKNHFLYLSKSDKKLQKMIQASKRKQKISIGYLTENDIFADKISIQHYDIKLKMEFQYLKNQ